MLKRKSPSRGRCGRRGYNCRIEEKYNVVLHHLAAEGGIARVIDRSCCDLSCRCAVEAFFFSVYKPPARNGE